MPRGGRRSGKVGASYTNRSDLQQGPRVLPTTPVPGQTYGKGVAQQRSMSAVPMGVPGFPAPAATAPATAGGGGPPPPGAMAALANHGLPGLLDPTQHPNEPLTAGAPFGAGPGPAGLQFNADDNVKNEMLALYRAAPTREMREILEDF